jgi:hypothetical protein
MSPLPAITVKNDWRSDTARTAFPILVEYAHQRLPITYGELDKEITRRGLGKHQFATRYGGPAGVIGNACEEYSNTSGINVPPINLIVVNGQTRIPGDGADFYVRRFGRVWLKRKLTPESLLFEKKREIIRQAHVEIFDFPAWTEVLAAYGLKPTDADKSTQKPRWLPNEGQWHFGPESEEHKALKRLIAENPTILQLPSQERGKEEHRIWSGDEVDVYFVESEVAVEVKAANARPSEIHRGLFQCVKYKAVLRAQQIYRQIIPTADCVLAIGGKLPSGFEEFANVMGIRVFENLCL